MSDISELERQLQLQLQQEITREKYRQADINLRLAEIDLMRLKITQLWEGGQHDSLVPYSPGPVHTS